MLGRQPVPGEIEHSDSPRTRFLLLNELAVIILFGVSFFLRMNEKEDGLFKFSRFWTREGTLEEFLIFSIFLLSWISWYK